MNFSAPLNGGMIHANKHPEHARWFIFLQKWRDILRHGFRVFIWVFRFELISNWAIKGTNVDYYLDSLIEARFKFENEIIS